jgi:hypothetical protein
VNLNHARLARFSDWATTLPPRPLPRTVIPVPGEYHLGYIRRLAEASHLEFLQLAEIASDTAAITLHRGRWEQHQQERLATLASQPLPRIARLYWPDPAQSMRDPEAFRQALRPACRRCTARRGITEPVACHLPPHLTVCRRHQIWIGPSARAHAGQLDISQLPGILRAQRRHLALIRHHQWWQVDDAISDATRTIHRALRAGTWTPSQQQRLHQLDPGTWHQDTAGTTPGWRYGGPASPAIEIAIYPDIIQLAARNLWAPGTSCHLPA